MEKHLTVNYRQGSQEWLDWRKTKITASEIPIILGVSKWCTPLLLWQRKIGFASEQSDNFAMQKGRDLEPVVRDFVNKKYQFNFIPEVVVHPELDWAAASLDGITDKYILEIKCPGLADHQKAEEGVIPEHYYPQVQWQLFCSGLKSGYYASHYKKQTEIFEFSIDQDYIDSIMPTVLEFYKCMTELIEPAYSENDFVQITDDAFPEVAREWKAASELAKFYKNKESFFKDKILDFTDDSNCEGCGLKIKRVDRKGSIDWESLWNEACFKNPDLSDSINVESFRKDQIGYWKIYEKK